MLLLAACAVQTALQGAAASPPARPPRPRPSPVPAPLPRSYYNWRQDTWSDLQLFATFNLLLLLLGAWVQSAVVRQLDGTVPTPADTNEPEWFGSLYSVRWKVVGWHMDPPQLLAWHGAAHVLPGAAQRPCPALSTRYI